MTEREPSNSTDAAAPPPEIDRTAIDSLLAEITAVCGHAAPSAPAAAPAEDDPLTGLVARFEQSAPDPSDARPAATDEPPGAAIPSRESAPPPAAAIDEAAPSAPIDDAAPPAAQAAAPAAAPDAPSAAVPAPALGSLDDALASDVGDLLGGNFETVSAVLGDTDQALIAQDFAAGSAIAPDPDAVHLAPHAPETADPDLLDDAFSFAPPDGGDELDAPVPVPPPAARPGDGGPLPARAAPEVPTTVEAHAPEPIPARADAIASEPAAVPAPPAPLARPAPPAPPPGDVPGAPPGPTGRLATIWIHAEPFVVDVLRTANRPLRRVPPPMRPIVDWIALSLVFWVPIVWAVALFIVG